jgi:hypothetical protein
LIASAGREDRYPLAKYGPRVIDDGGIAKIPGMAAVEQYENFLALRIIGHLEDLAHGKTLVI